MDRNPRDAPFAQLHVDTAERPGIFGHFGINAIEDSDHRSRACTGLGQVHAARETIRIVAQIDRDAPTIGIDLDLVEYRLTRGPRGTRGTRGT